MLFFIFIISAIILSLYAQLKVLSTYKKYSTSINSFGLTGSDAAKIILINHNLSHIGIETVDGYLTDHYDPSSKTVRLSTNVYNGTSLSSIGVAAHETGHALQHCTNYLPLRIRSSIVHIAAFGSWMPIPIIILGTILGSAGLITFGIITFIIIFIFYIITLPIEFNASKRALDILANGFLTYDEIHAARKVLNAAALTYVAAPTNSIAELIRYLIAFFTEKDR
ncbi:MAG: zinc metallopeptidase [Ignavibacteriales bacterium]